MSDECPPEITNPGVRKNWHLFDAESRAGFVLDATGDQRAVSRGGGNGRTNGPHGSRQSQYYGLGMRPPQGDPYNTEEYNADGEGDGTRQFQRGGRGCPPSRSASGGSGDGRNRTDRRRRLSPGGTFARVLRDGGQHARDEHGTTSIDPALFRADQETATAAKNRQLEARLAALEAHLPGTTQALPVPPSQGRDARGATARGRGRHRVSRRPRVPTPVPSDADEPPEDSDDDANDVYAPDPNAPKDDLDPLTILNIKYKELSPTQKKAVLKCQSVVSASFRDVTGVPTTKHPWPKWTGEGDWTGPGMEINLEGTVTHRVNRALFRRVSEVAMQDLKKDKSTNQQWMNAPDVKLTLGLLIEIAKCTFRGFKRPYRAQHDADAKKRLDDNGRFSRWLSRRRQTCHNLMSAVPEYKEIHGVDPTPLLVSDLMSDEASGPEEGGETVLEWKRRMATLEGRVDVSDEFLTKKTYFEVITPNWRSDALTKIYHELARLWYNTLSVRFANAMVTRIRTSKRATNVPPAYTPYNFGINQEWYTENKSEPTYKILLRMWGQFPDPPGFGANTEPEAAPAETINAAASTSGSV